MREDDTREVCGVPLQLLRYAARHQDCADRSAKQHLPRCIPLTRLENFFLSSHYLPV